MFSTYQITSTIHSYYQNFELSSACIIHADQNVSSIDNISLNTNAVNCIEDIRVWILQFIWIGSSENSINYIG